MYDKKAFLASLTQEAKIIKHLLSLLKPAQYSFRFSDGQRTTLELARYLTVVGQGATVYALTGGWEHWEPLATKANALSPAAIPKALDAQLRAVTKALASFTDAKLRTKNTKDWNGKQMPLGIGLVEMVLKVFAAYRMQLFLQAKASGLAHIGTSDCWLGKSAKAPKVKTAKAAKG